MIHTVQSLLGKEMQILPIPSGVNQATGRLEADSFRFRLLEPVSFTDIPTRIKEIFEKNDISVMRITTVNEITSIVARSTSGMHLMSMSLVDMATREIKFSVN